MNWYIATWYERSADEEQEGGAVVWTPMKADIISSTKIEATVFFRYELTRDLDVIHAEVKYMGAEVDYIDSQRQLELDFTAID